MSYAPGPQITSHADYAAQMAQGMPVIRQTLLDQPEVIPNADAHEWPYSYTAYLIAKGWLFYAYPQPFGPPTPL